MKKQPLVTTVLLVFVVFAIGVIVGNVWQSSATQDVSKVLRQSELDTESFLVEQELFESFETSCQLAEKRLDDLSTELWSLGKVLGTEHARETLGEEDYQFLKRKYHLLQARTYVFAKKLQDDCGKKANFILYYYERADPLSAQQGRILDDLVDQYNLHVFAIEYNYSKELVFLQEYYDITQTPALIVNFEHTFTGLTTKDRIIPLLNE